MTLSSLVRGFFGLVAIATLLLPTDLIPDLAPLVGWLDDLLAIGYLFVEVLKFIRNRRNVNTKS